MLPPFAGDVGRYRHTSDPLRRYDRNPEHPGALADPMHDILVLDVAGTPVRWVDHESAASYYASGKVRWELGTGRTVLHGGISRQYGRRSTLEIAAIIAIDGPRWRFRGAEDRVALTRNMVFARDRHVCAYCGGRFVQGALEMEHVTPSSRGGFTVWQNVVSACRACNQRKGNRSPEAAGMPLLYVPYVPNRHEAFILANRRILEAYETGGYDASLRWRIEHTQVLHPDDIARVAAAGLIAGIPRPAYLGREAFASWLGILLGKRDVIFCSGIAPLCLPSPGLGMASGPGEMPRVRRGQPTLPA
jgi:hypothetical protein